MFIIAKPVVSYLAAGGLHWLANRYHLSGDQISAIVTDFGTIAAMAYAVQTHITAKNGEKDHG